MNDLIKAMESKTPGPCGGYTTMYQCMCDYHAMPFREEVEWVRFVFSGVKFLNILKSAFQGRK